MDKVKIKIMFIFFCFIKINAISLYTDSSCSDVYEIINNDNCQYEVEGKINNINYLSLNLNFDFLFFYNNLNCTQKSITSLLIGNSCKNVSLNNFNINNNQINSVCSNC